MLEPEERKLMLGKAYLYIFVILFSFLLAVTGETQSSESNRSPGLALGDTAPSFQAHDQSGVARNLKSVAGENGTVLLFFRSADW
jgi:hypothetical protein